MQNSHLVSKTVKTITTSKRVEDNYFATGKHNVNNWLLMNQS